MAKCLKGLYLKTAFWIRWKLNLYFIALNNCYFYRPFPSYHLVTVGDGQKDAQHFCQVSYNTKPLPMVGFKYLSNLYLLLTLRETMIKSNPKLTNYILNRTLNSRKLFDWTHNSNGTCLNPEPKHYKYTCKCTS